MENPSPNAHAVVIHSAGDVRVESRRVDNPAPHEAQVDIALGGICGSDISYFKHGAVGRFEVTAPMILGHEVIGTVREIGADATGLDHGQRVAVDPSAPCLTCENCVVGRFNICLKPTFLGSASTQPHVDGGFASMLLAKAKNLVPLEDSLDDELAVFAEPLAVTVHAVERSGGVAGAKILIIGVGPIGAMLAALCVHLGAAEVATADIASERLGTVASLGAHRQILVGEEDLGANYDIVFDASGAATAIADGLERVRRGGKFVLVGLPHGGPVPMPINLSITGEVDVLGSFRFNHNEFRGAVDLLSEGLDLRPLITNRHGFEHAHDALSEAASGNAMKVQLDFSTASEGN